MKTVGSVKRMICVLTGMICLSWMQPAGADAETLTLKEALSFALENNGELQALHAEQGIRDAAKIKAGQLPNPVLELGGTTGRLTNSPEDNIISVGIAQEFLTFGKRGKRLNVAEQELGVYDFQVAHKRRLLLADVKRAFNDALLAQKRAELAAQSLELNQQLADITRKMVAEGDVAELDLNLARVEAARAEAVKLQLEGELHAALSELMALTGTVPTDDVRIVGSFTTQPVDRNLEDLKATALASRLDLKAIEAERARSDAEIQLAKSERMPNLTAGLSLNYEESLVEVDRLESRDRAFLIGARVSIPIPLFDRNQSGVREAVAKKESAGSRYAFARKTVEREVEGAYARVKAAEKSLSIYKETTLPQLRENVKLVQDAYRLGEVGIQAIIEEQKKFAEINNDYLTALHGLEAALIKLETVVGIEPEPESMGGAK